LVSDDGLGGHHANLTMLRVNGWQLYVRRDGDSVTLIDTGAPGSGAEIMSGVPDVDRIVLIHGHVDHIGSAAESREATGASVKRTCPNTACCWPVTPSPTSAR
jgi:glyoxylase-like metal-dependent hydrolase (beta-lactamase superfamily II)